MIYDNSPICPECGAEQEEDCFCNIPHCPKCGGQDSWFCRTMEEPCGSMHTVCECGHVYPCPSPECLYNEELNPAPKLLAEYTQEIKRSEQDGDKAYYDLGSLEVTVPEGTAEKYLSVKILVFEEERTKWDG